MDKIIDNCQECPFANQDNESGYNFCNLKDFELDTLELPEKEVHKDCPLRENEYLIKVEGSMEQGKPLREGSSRDVQKGSPSNIRPTGPPPSPEPILKTVSGPVIVAGALSHGGNVCSEECLKSMAAQRPDILSYDPKSASLNLSGTIMKSHIDKDGDRVIDLLDIHSVDCCVKS